MSFKKATLILMILSIIGLILNIVGVIVDVTAYGQYLSKGFFINVISLSCVFSGLIIFTVSLYKNQKGDI